MDAAETIRNSVARVTALRRAAAAHDDLQAANRAVKRLQARRFAGTYADLLESSEYSGAARFFLDELYSDKDYSLRDAQFSRIAGALQTFFPEQVVATAVALAELHALTEELDQEMALAWLAQGGQHRFLRLPATWAPGRPLHGRTTATVSLPWCYRSGRNSTA